MKTRVRKYLTIGLAAAWLLQGCGGGSSVVYDPYSVNYQQAGRVDSYSNWETLNDRGRGTR